MSWEQFRKNGMLGGVYIKAFETFLRLTGWKWPSTPVSSDVLLFRCEEMSEVRGWVAAR
jgi:hypothetical protein